MISQRPQSQASTIIMRIILLLALLLVSCERDQPKITPEPSRTNGLEAQSILKSVVRVNATRQDWNQWQPWEKEPPRRNRALAAIINAQQVITTAEIAANATYLEFESADGTRFITAKVIARDDEANLALLGPADPKEGAEFFRDTVAFDLAQPSTQGDMLDILQVEANGTALLTSGPLQSVELTSSFLPGHQFLTYMVKASMQSAASSYTLPVTKDGKLAGVLLSYDSKDQICDVASTDILQRFLEAATKDQYQGFPSLGVKVAMTEDKSLRDWLKLGDEQGGIYIHGVQENSAAKEAGIQKGDVLLEADGNAIDRRGYYDHPQYGKLSWAHLVRATKAVGDPLELRLLRGGEELELSASLKRSLPSDQLVPDILLNQQPSYLVKGGLIFQELTRDILKRYGKDWTSRAPLNLLDAHDNPQRYEQRMRRVVFLSSVIPTPATVGYERLRHLIVSKVNGMEIKDMADLAKAFQSKTLGMHSIEFIDEHIVVYLDERITSAVDTQLLQRGLSKLAHYEQAAQPDKSEEGDSNQ